MLRRTSLARRATKPSTSFVSGAVASRSTSAASSRERGSGGDLVGSRFSSAARARFRGLVTVSLVVSSGDDETAGLMYDTETIPVTSATGAECLTVRRGKITRSRFIFDRKPFEDARAG
jgi:hypothetical protein